MSMLTAPAPRDGVDLKTCTEPDHIPRFFSYLIDYVVFFAVVAVFVGLGGRVVGDGQVETLAVSVLALSIHPVLGGLFEGALWHATPGKLLFRLKVVHRDGTFPTMGQAMVRNFAKWIGLSMCNLLSLTIFFDRYDRGCWDAVADTVVVRVR